MPLNIPESIRIFAHFPTADKQGETIRVGIEVRSVEHVYKVRNMIFKKYKKTIRDDSDTLNENEFILKVTGSQEFLFGASQLLSYDYVRKKISLAQPLDLTFIKISELSELLDELCYAPTLVDKLLVSTPSPFHLENSHASDPSKLANKIDVFSVTDKFSVKLLNAERLTIPPELLSDSTFLYVAVDIYIAGSTFFFPSNFFYFIFYLFIFLFYFFILFFYLFYVSFMYLLFKQYYFFHQKIYLKIN